MKNQTKKGVSRRRFLNTALVGAAGLAVLPGLVTSCAQKVVDTDIKLGFIGMGRQAMFLLNGFIQIPGVKVVAGCDVYGIKRQRFEKRVSEFYAKAGKEVKVETYEKYEDLLKREDINAVVIATPDHTHAMIAIAACKAGKDVYLEKPMTFTIKEGQELVKVVRENNRILGIGSQQRSDPNFQYAVNLVQSGALGQIERVNAYVGAPPKPYDLPEEPIPADLNWDLWLGPLPQSIHYNHELNPPISLDPPKDEDIWGAWRWYKEMGGGFTTDWGAHMFDVAQWGLGMDGSGPVEISPIGDGTEFMSFTYANGVVMTSEPFDEKLTKGVKFWGKDGWIEVARGYFNASDPKFMPEKKEEQEGPYETKIPHQINFIEAVQQRKDPVVPVETGHSSCTVCTLGNIACELKRTIKWDPATQTFVDDADGAATQMMHYEYRTGWKLI
ncbi:MAG TPA: Gfo/Idh/MocA family oxidoreductase [Prolixibacteraceae bacterium]|nr:Gfo/Idh/MocA family oxidoreductase [Prolixibacteraceae bacterium]